jgi:hypothetical protein
MRSNAEIVEDLFAPICGMDMIPSYRAANAGDDAAVEPAYATYLSEWVALLDRHFEWDITDLEFPDARVVRGVVEFATFWQVWLENWDTYVANVDNVTAVGDHVIFDVTVRVRGAHSEVEAVRMHLFKDRAAALAAATPS